MMERQRMMSTSLARLTCQLSLLSRHVQKLLLSQIEPREVKDFKRYPDRSWGLDPGEGLPGAQMASNPSLWGPLKFMRARLRDLIIPPPTLISSPSSCQLCSQELASFWRLKVASGVVRGSPIRRAEASCFNSREVQPFLTEDFGTDI